ncbi:MAG: SRPBCC family protein [Nocardioides sp.]
MTDTHMTDSMVIERTLDAPADLVWQMWTEPEHFEAWYGPQGATITVVTMDVRVGGTRLVGMKMDTPNGPMQMWFIGEHRDVVRPQRLSYTESMSDPEGNVLAADQTGMPSGHPTTTKVTVELAGLDRGTKMTLTHAGIPADSPGAAGWQMAIDKLAAHLKTHNHA